MEKTKKHIRQAAAAIVSLLFLVALDQLTKYLTVTHLHGGSDISLIPGVLILTYVENRGAAFGVLQGGRIFFFVTTAVLLALVVWAYIRMLLKDAYRPLRVLFVFIAAGGIGNLIDRLFRGFVVDMIYFKPIDFPVFNIADCYITVSAFLLILFVLLLYRDDDFSFLFGSEQKRE